MVGIMVVTFAVKIWCPIYSKFNNIDINIGHVKTYKSLKNPAIKAEKHTSVVKLLNACIILT